MTRFAGYELLDRLQPGNHGTFHAARPPATLGRGDETVALKILDRHATDNEFKRMAAELRVLVELGHPRLVEVIDAGHEGGRLYYATPWYPEGGLGLGPVGSGPEADAVAVAVADAAEAAHALHQVGVAHRDIKPSNLLRSGGRAVLCDLGVANHVNAQFTATGSSPVGTLTFADPRLVHGDRPGRASDVWSLGATLHAALTGRSVLGPVPTTHLAAAIEYVLGAEARVDPACPARYAGIVARAVRADRADRYPTAADLAAELRAAAGLAVEPAPLRPPASGGEPLPHLGPDRGPALTLVLPDGTSVLVDGPAVVGRQPEVDPRVGDGRARAVTVDGTLGTSRAHVLVDPGSGDGHGGADDGPVVTGLSRNGTEIEPGDGSAAVVLAAGASRILRPGDAVLLGSGRLVVHRHQTPDPDR